jgi:hypothetical protein
MDTDGERRKTEWDMLRGTVEIVVDIDLTLQVRQTREYEAPQDRYESLYTRT